MSGIYEIYVKDHFSAAHALKGYKGNCSRLHGHNWIIEVFIKCRELNSIGIGMDFREIKKKLKQVLKKFDHANLNEISAFAGVNPTSEHIAKIIYEELSSQINTDSIKVSKVKVCETPGCGSSYEEE